MLEVRLPRYPWLVAALTAESVVHTHGMVCGAPALAPHRNQPLPAFDASIHLANTHFPRGSPISILRLVCFVDGRFCENFALFLLGKPYLDDIGVWDAPFPLPH